MKRFVWGIICIVAGLVLLTEEEFMGQGFIYIIGGGLLTYYGNRYLQRLKQISGICIDMTRDKGEIDTAEMSHRIGLPEIDVRIYISEAQRKGLVPFKSTIV